ncbi:hypothetical protein [Burkholderia lata]|uniref:hypothetical protein n=1 Tax=Burkholderia lata (strain ATCC 17760 / DSM 23089 / LMG 22485 / NCIMB 9086 / R18194 / 383) TaxID=482957 RepID=UPI0015833B4B|nr:hypothetical protein [Burkholderia lata]
MKNVKIVRIVLFLGLLWSGLPLHARTVVFENGVKMDLPIYKNKQVNPDGAVCVDVSRMNVIATICSYGNSADGVAGDNGFFKYKDLSREGVRQVSSLPDDAYVYVEGGYSFLYPASKRRIGGFTAYEVDNVLCKTDSDDGDRPAVCYAAALVPRNHPNTDPNIFVFAIIEQPPSPGGNLNGRARGKVMVINEIIRSIKIYR